MPTNYLRWEGMRRGQRWEKPVLALLCLAVLASGAHALTSYQRHQRAAAECARGEAAWCQGRLGDAQAAFEAALRADPAYFPARDQLSIIAWQKGDRERSVQLLREGIRLHPDSPQAYRALGETLFLLHNFRGAIPVLEQAERLEPTPPGTPSLLESCRQALADPPRSSSKPGPWTGLRTHGTIHGHTHPGHAGCDHERH